MKNFKFENVVFERKKMFKTFFNVTKYNKIFYQKKKESE